MGALLSIPLLALPSAGSVRLEAYHDLQEITADTAPAHHIRRIMLWRGNMQRSLLSMREMPEQHGDPYRLRSHTPPQFHSQLDHAYRLGRQEAAAFGAGLCQYLM